MKGGVAPIWELEAMRGQPSGSTDTEKIRLKILRNLTNRSKSDNFDCQQIFFQFIGRWLLPCSLRSHRIANPRPKMGFAIFRLYPPTTLQADDIKLKRILLNLINRKIGQFYIPTKIFSFPKDKI